MESQANERYEKAEKEKDENKKWTNLDDTLKKTILFASSTDGETPAEVPSEQTLKLVKCKTGGAAAV